MKADINRVIDALKELKEFDFNYSQEKLDSEYQKGLSALQEIIQTKKDVANAINRVDVGDIDFKWGNEGNPQKEFAGGFGVSHIIAKRDWERLNKPSIHILTGEQVAQMLVKVLVYGFITDIRGRILELSLDNYVAIVKQTEQGKWWLTGFFNLEEK